MTEIHVVGAHNAPRYARQLESYYRWRHLIYVEERGWHDLGSPDGLERDQFDTDDAVHLLALQDGEVVGGSRMIPMSKPTLVGTVFQHLAERGPLPCDDKSVEWTRMFVVPAHRLGRRPRSVAGAIFCGVMEYCCTIGADRVGGVQETFWLPKWQEFGWVTRPFGLPQEVGGAMTLVAYMDVSEAALIGVRTATGWDRSILAWNGHPDHRPSQDRAVA
jgi:acyl-homoserine lactone synthase